MDISLLVNWIQSAIWLVAVVIYLGRLASGETVMPQRLKTVFSSNAVIGTVIALGLIGSGVSLYPTIAIRLGWKSLTLNVSAYQPADGPLTVISNQTFENADVPLDGHVYDHCRFINSCFLYDGGAYQLHNSVVINHWRVCVKDDRLKNFSQLMSALEMVDPRIKFTSKTVVKPRF